MVDKNVDKTTREADNRPPTPARPPTTRLTQRLGENGLDDGRNGTRRDETVSGYMGVGGGRGVQAGTRPMEVKL